MIDERKIDGQTIPEQTVAERQIRERQIRPQAIAAQARTAATLPERPGFMGDLSVLPNQLLIHGVESPRQSGDEQRGPAQIMPALFQFQRSLPIPGDHVHGSFLVSFAHRRHRPRGAESLSKSPARLQPPLAKRIAVHCLSVRLLPPPCPHFTTHGPRFTIHCSPFPLAAFLTTNHCPLITAFDPPPYASAPHPPYRSTHPLPPPSPLAAFLTTNHYPLTTAFTPPPINSDHTPPCRFVKL